MSGIVDRFNRPISSSEDDAASFAGQRFNLPPPGQCPMVDPMAAPAQLEPEAETIALRKVVTDTAALINLTRILSRLSHALAHEVIALRERVRKLERKQDEAPEPGGPEGSSGPEA